MLTKFEALERLRVLAAGLRSPVWLTGGLGADLLVGRWTRDHGDIDLVTFEEYRNALDAEFGELGFTMTGDRGWITNWTRSGREWGEVSLGYARRMGPPRGRWSSPRPIATRGSCPASIRAWTATSTLIGSRRWRAFGSVWSLRRASGCTLPASSAPDLVRAKDPASRATCRCWSRDPETLDRLRPLAGRRLPLDRS